MLGHTENMCLVGHKTKKQENSGSSGDDYDDDEVTMFDIVEMIGLLNMTKNEVFMALLK